MIFIGRQRPYIGCLPFTCALEWVKSGFWYVKFDEDSHILVFFGLKEALVFAHIFGFFGIYWKFTVLVASTSVLSDL